MLMVDATFSDLRAVVVDDNRNFQTIMRTMLRHFGFRHVESFLDPQDALAYVKENPTDLAFVDHLMPSLNGVEWIRRARRITGLANRDMAAVMVTGNANPRVLHAALAAGVDDVLAKPLAPDTLLQHIRRVLARPRRYQRGADGYYGPEVASALRRLHQAMAAKFGGPVPVRAPAPRPVPVPTPARVLPKLAGLDVEIRDRPSYDDDALYLD